MSESIQSLICSSFPHANIKSHNLKSILNTFGPHLHTFNHYSRTSSSITLLQSTKFIQDIERTSQLEIKFAGMGTPALFKCYSFVLLIIGCKQIKFYPHLLTLIKQQFFKPNIFIQYDTQIRNRILTICKNIQIQLISSVSVYDFIQNNSEFLQGFANLLSKIIGETSFQSPNTIIDTLSKRFNIDCGKIQICPEAQGWVLGMQRKIYLIQQNQYFFVISPSTSTEPIPNIYESMPENRLQSQKSASEQIIIEPSEQSTPKFKDNQESIRYRKKSHKNSFGGDFDITGYEQLAKLVNKSLIGENIYKQKEGQQLGKKVFSVQLQTYQKKQFIMPDQNMAINGLQQNNMDQIGTQQFLINENNQYAMKGSNIEGNQKIRMQNQGMQKEYKKKQIASSEIFKFENKNMTNKIRFQYINPQEQKEKNYSNQPQDREDILINHPPCPAQLTQFNDQEQFKISFSKKDSDKFVNLNYQQHHLNNKKYQKQQIKNRTTLEGKKIRSSLTILNMNQKYNINNEDFQKRLYNRRSLLIQSTINPIEQQRLNSHQDQTQQQSLGQSQNKNDQLLNDKKQKKPWNKKGKQHLFTEEQIRDTLNRTEIQMIGQKNEQTSRNYLNIFKNKNRKFSYLTQPITMGRNNQFVHNQKLLKQSYMEQQQQFQIKQDSQAIKQQKNKSKSPKIHKNSQAITQNNTKKKRFQQNPISFSQMIANININQQNAEDSNFSAHSLKHTNNRAPKLSLESNILQFRKNNTMCYNQPQEWTKKQVVYYFDGNRKAERFIIERTSIKKYQQIKNIELNNAKTESKKVSDNFCDLQIPFQIKSNKQQGSKKEQAEEDNRQEIKILKTQQDNFESTNPKESSRKNASFSSQQGIKYINQTLNTTNNLRSTIQTSKSANTLPYSINNPNIQIIQEFQSSDGLKNNNQISMGNKQQNNFISSLSISQSHKKFIEIPNFQPPPIYHHALNSNLNSIRVISPNNKKQNKIQYSKKQIRQPVFHTNKQNLLYKINSPQSSSFQIPSHPSFIQNANPNDQAFLKHHPHIYFPRSPINQPRAKAQTFFYSPTHTTTTIPSQTFIPSQNYLQIEKNMNKNPLEHRLNFFPKKQKNCMNTNPSKPCCTGNNANVKVEHQRIMSPPRLWSINPQQNNNLVQKICVNRNFLRTNYGVRQIN